MTRLAVVTLCIILHSLLGSAQEQRSYDELHDQWLASLSQEVKSRMDSYLAAGIKSEQLRYSLAMEKIPIENLEALEQAGVKFTDMSNLWRKEYSHRAVEFECIVIGTIKRITYDTADASCFHTLVEVQPERYVRASSVVRRAPTLIISLRSGPLSQGRRRELTHEFRPELGTTYVFFLSNHILRYSMAHTTSCRYELTETTFFASEMSPRVVGKQVWFPHSKRRQPIDEFLTKIGTTINILTR